MSKCKAITAKKKRCSRNAQEGSKYCKTHDKKDEPIIAKLTNKQKLFCEYYIQTWNATESARKAGYKGSENTLRSIGSENLTKPNISEFIKKRVDEVSMSTDEAIKRLTDWGRGTVEHFITEDSYSEGLSLNTESAKRNLGLIKKIKQSERAVQIQDSNETVINRTFEIELHDPKDAVDKILKIQGAYAPSKIDHELTGKDGGAIENVVFYIPDNGRDSSK